MIRPVAADRRLDQLGRVAVTGIEVWAHHGVFDAERQDGQRFLIDVEWWQELPRNDRLDGTADYGELSSYVAGLAQGSPVSLIETVAMNIQEALLHRYAVDFVRVRVHKPDAPLDVAFADVAVTTPIAARGGGRQVVFSLGSNIEPRWEYLQFGASALASTPGITRAQVSPVYETQAQGPAQPHFLNAVVVARSDLSAMALLRRGLAIEDMARRTRDIVHGPRTLDIDLIDVGGERWDRPDLTVPHPRAAGRAFVLDPWSDLDPDARLGVTRVADLRAAVAGQKVRRWPADLFLP